MDTYFLYYTPHIIFILNVKKVAIIIVVTVVVDKTFFSITTGVSWAYEFCKFILFPMWLYLLWDLVTSKNVMPTDNHTAFSGLRCDGYG